MKSHSQPHHEERIAKRQAVHCPFCYSDGEFYASGVIEDWTPAGIRVQGTHPVRLGMKLVVFLIPPGHRPSLLICRATVRWINGTRSGMALTDISPESHAELVRLAAIHLPALWSGLN